MLISKSVKTRWNSKTKKYYESKGYVYTKMGDFLNVNVFDLKDGSSELVEVECDYCHSIYNISWSNYLNHRKKLIQKDCCGNPECTGGKAQETIRQKYNVDNFRQIEGMNDKIKQTNLLKYGAENPFASEEIKEKIRNTNISRYGVAIPTKNEEIHEKYKKTCLEKYGVENYSFTDEFKLSVRGENNPRWKGDNVKHERTERNSPEYAEWRKSVFKRDNYICQCCGRKSMKGDSVTLIAHHIENWSTCIDKRYDINNGITFCKECHIKFHSNYGIKNNNQEQVFEFINNYIDEKIC